MSEHGTMTAGKPNRSAAAKKKKLQQEGPGYQIFSVINNVFMFIVILATLYPIYFVVVASISEAGALVRHGSLLLYPVGKINIYSYKLVFRNPQVISGFRNTMVVLFGGLAVNMAMTCLGAYILTLKDSMFRKFFSIFILITMYFSGGMIPTYLNIRDLKLLDSLWALIIPGAISTYNMLVLRSAFASIPDGLQEAAVLDGASHWDILTRVYIPLSGATLAVLVLYYGVAHWNAWFDASIYLSTPTKFPLQLILRQILVLNQNNALNASITTQGELAQYSDQVKYALIVVSTAPILCLYPFLQRFFTKGVMVGAMKG